MHLHAFGFYHRAKLKPFALQAKRCIRVVDALAAQAILDADPPTRRLRMRIRLNVDAGDVRQALLVRPSLKSTVY